MSERTIADDFSQLVFAAAKTLEHALDDGVKKGYQPGHWKTISMDEHLEHAKNHIAGWEFSSTSPAAKEHIEHAVCRLLMAYALIGERK